MENFVQCAHKNYMIKFGSRLQKRAKWKCENWKTFLPAYTSKPNSNQNLWEWLLYYVFMVYNS